MTIKVEMVGSGELGEIQPGWSVNEYATPVTIGETAGGTGDVSFSTSSRPTSLLTVNNNITTIVEEFGAITGIVNNVSRTGLSTSVSHNTQLALFDSDYSIPALGAGGIYPAIDVCSQLSGRDKLLKYGTGSFFSLCGHSAGFDIDGNIVKSSVSRKAYQSYSDSIGFYTNYYQEESGPIWANGFTVKNDTIYATSVLGDQFQTSTVERSCRIAFKTLIDTPGEEVWLRMGRGPMEQNAGSYNMTMNVGIEYPADYPTHTPTLYLSGDYYAGGSGQSFSLNYNLNGLDMTKELGVFVEYIQPAAGSSSHTIKVQLTMEDNGFNGVAATLSRTFSSDYSLYNENWSIAGLARSLMRIQDTGLPSTGTEISRINYAKNPSFAKKISGVWTPTSENWGKISGLETFSFVLDYDRAGFAPYTPVDANVIKVAIPITNTYSQYGKGISQKIEIPFNAGVYYTFSAWLKQSVDPEYVHISFDQYSADGTFLRTSSYNNSIITSSTWQRIEAIDFILEATSYVVAKVVSYEWNNSIEFFLDAAKFEEGFGGTSYFDGMSQPPSSEFSYAYVDGYSYEYVTSGTFAREYENVKTYSISDAPELGGPVTAQQSNMWTYLQNACSAYGQELSITQDNLVVRPIGTNVIDITNIVGAPNISAGMMFNGRNVEIEYSNAEQVNYTELYNARDDDNRIISVKTLETVVTTVPVKGTPSILVQPTRSTTAPNGVGQYCVITESGTQVPQLLWERRGGLLQVAVSSTIPDSIDVTVTGPSAALASDGYVGPYSIAYSSGGSNNYGALSIIGYGVSTDKKTLKLRTASDDSKVSQDVAKTIINPFIATVEQAYDRGIWAGIMSSGPSVSFSCTLPASVVTAFGLVAGSIFRYEDSIYRIISATIGNASVSINAIRHVTVGDFDSTWSGKTVWAHDSTWSGYQTSDQVIYPLYLVGDDESVIMSLDSDVNPYWDLSGEPEISVFRDADITPYYADGGNLEGSDEIFIDTDNNPYDGDL